jgi:hypothetical protein
MDDRAGGDQAPGTAIFLNSESSPPESLSFTTNTGDVKSKNISPESAAGKAIREFRDHTPTTK